MINIKVNELPGETVPLEQIRSLTTTTNLRPVNPEPPSCQQNTMTAERTFVALCRQ